MQVVKVDDGGRVVIPAEYRKKLEIKKGQEVVIDHIGSTLTLSKKYNTCLICDKQDTKANFKELFPDKVVCPKCTKKYIK